MIYAIDRGNGGVEVREGNFTSLPEGAKEVTEEQKEQLLRGEIGFNDLP